MHRICSLIILTLPARAFLSARDQQGTDRLGVSGVINIITREPDNGTFVPGDVSFGQNDFHNTDFMVGGKGGNNKNILQYSFYASRNELSYMNIRKR